MPIEITGNTLRIRQRDPSMFKTEIGRLGLRFYGSKFITLDVGNTGGYYQIRGRLKTGEMAIQSHRFDVNALKEKRQSTWNALITVLEKRKPEDAIRVRKLLIERGVSL